MLMRYAPIACFALAALLACTAAEATTVLPSDLRKLTADAQAIVHGRVVEVQAQWATTRRGIDTLVTVEATDYLKGNFGARVVFRVPGGKIGRYRSVMVGAPVFRPGDEVVVFLAATGPAIPHIVGFNQGVFHVSVQPATGQRVVASPLLAPRVRAATPLVRGDPSRVPVPLTQMEQQVRSIIEQQQQRSNVAQPRRGVAIPRGK